MKKIFILSLLLLTTNISFAQSEDEKAIQSVVTQLFEGIEKHDSTLLRNTLHPSARIQRMGVNSKTGLNFINTENNIDNFIKEICQNSINVAFKEIPKSFEIKIDNQLATAWTPYEFYRNEKSSHCGVDSFQFFKTDKGWKILSLIYTIHKCE